MISLSHVDLGSSNGDISANGPNLWSLLTVPSEGKNVVAGRQHWHLDKINEIEIEASSPECMLLCTALLTRNVAGASGLAVAVKPSLGNTWHILGIYRRRELWPIFTTCMHHSSAVCAFAKGNRVSCPHGAFGESTVDNANRWDSRAVGLALWHSGLSILDPLNIADKIEHLLLEALLAHLTDV
jgi:hypothetical protein